MHLFDTLVHLEVAAVLVPLLGDHDNPALRCCSKFTYDYCNLSFILWQLDIAITYLADLYREEAIEEELEATFCILHSDPDWTWESD